MVILGRAIIGVGASSLAMVSISILTDVVPPERRGTAIGYQTMFVYMGLSFGPALGGALNDLVGWRLLFLITVPMAVASTIIILTGFHKEIAVDKDGSFDLRNSVLYGAAMLLSMGGVMNLPAVWAAVCVVIGILLLALFVRSQINNSRCLLNMGLFKNWTFSGSCLAAFMNYASSFSISFFLALYLQSIGGLTATEAGLLMIVQPVVQCIFTPFFGKLTDRISNKIILPTVGMILTSICILTYVFYTLDTPKYVVAMSMVIGGFGFAMFSAPNSTLIMSSVPKEHSSEASAVLSVMRQTGMMVSMGIAMTYITVIMGSTDNLGPETYGLFLQVLELSMITCFIMCIIGTIASISRGKPKQF
ncbi:MFS transporter [methanogenic archaeon mixed culture ISO4-G1]|nr:MFS transporter [methanogenic archaeon mixed culture ISO4-G1]